MLIHYSGELQSVFFVMVLLFCHYDEIMTKTKNLNHLKSKLGNCSNDTKNGLYYCESEFSYQDFIKSNIAKQFSLRANQTVAKLEPLRQHNLHLVKITPTENRIFKLRFHNALQGVIDLMLFWKRITNSVFLIDDWSDIKVSKMKKYLDLSLFLFGAKIRFDIIKINAQSNFFNILTNSSFPNFVLICRENTSLKVLEAAKLMGIFEANRTWMIVNDRIPEIFFSTVISEKSLVTVLVYEPPNRDSEKLVSNSVSNISETNFLKPNLFLTPEDLCWYDLSFTTSVNIYDLFYVFQQKKIEFIKFANWSAQEGLHVFEFFEENDNFQKLRGRAIRVAGFVHLPYVRVTRLDDGNVTITGFAVQVIEMLMEYFNASATYKAYEPVWGILLNGTFTGLLNRFHKKEAEVSMTGFSIVAGRVNVLNYLAPLTKIDTSMTYQTPMSTVPPTTYLYPFNWDVWILLLVISLVIAFALAVVMLLSPGWMNSEIPSLQLHSKTFRILTGTYLDEILEDPPGVPARLIFGAVLVGVLMSFIFYTSVFTSFLAYQDLKLPIRSMEDLVEDKEYGCVIVGKSVYEDIYRRAQAGTIFKRLWDNKIRRTLEYSLGKSILDGVQKMMRDHTVFVGDSASMIDTMNNNCSISVIRTSLMREDLYLVTRSDFPYSRIFYIRMLRIKEGGILRHLGKVYHTDSRPPCDTGLENLSSSFGIEQVVGLFFVLFVGIIIAFIALAAEYAVSLKSETSSAP